VVATRLLENIARRHTAIVGQTRSGKTYATRYILKALQVKGIHTIFFDPKHDDEYANLGVICYTPMQVYAKLLSKTAAIVYRPNPEKNKRFEELTRVINLTFEVSKTAGYKRIKRVIAIDEVQLMVKKGGNDGVERLWTVGAGQGILGLAITQRIQLLNETIWSQSENKILFKVEDRPEYLRSRNLDHFTELLPFFQAPENRYWFYATAGDGIWKKHPPAGKKEEKTGRQNNLKRVRLSRWQS
jgi:DNA helicase HerA-like ATPase